MSERPKTLVVASALACALIGAIATPAALADQQIVAGPPRKFSTSSATIDQGQKISFQNLDLDMHNVTATGKDGDGKPLFASDTIGTNQTAVIEGTQYLKTGSYSFLCTLHRDMTGTINVTAAGTPVTRPGTPSSPSSPGGAPGTQPAQPPTKSRKRKRCAKKRHGKRAKGCRSRRRHR